MDLANRAGAACPERLHDLQFRPGQRGSWHLQTINGADLTTVVVTYARGIFLVPHQLRWGCRSPTRSGTSSPMHSRDHPMAFATVYVCAVYPQTPIRGEFTMGRKASSSPHACCRRCSVHTNASPWSWRQYAHTSVAGCRQIAHGHAGNVFRASRRTIGLPARPRRSPTTLSCRGVVDPKSYSYSKRSPTAGSASSSVTFIVRSDNCRPTLPMSYPREK